MQTQNDIKNMNSQLAEYSNKSQGSVVLHNQVGALTSDQNKFRKYV
jgi:hypothetical protein